MARSDSGLVRAGSSFLLAMLLAIPFRVLAHSFGQSYRLPVPLWLYAWGAVAALLLSFVVAVYFLRAGPGKSAASRGLRLTGGWATVLLVVLRVLALVALLLCIVAGWWGHPNSNVNINMTLFWVCFAVGFAYFSVLIGGVFDAISPWATLGRLAAKLWGRFETGWVRYPEGLAYWPAVLLYLGFIWVELFGNTRPPSLALWLLGYTGLNLAASLLFGWRAWLRHGELFAVLFRLLSLMAPLRLRHAASGRYWRLSWPFAGLGRQPAAPVSLVLFVLVVLAGTAYDSLHESVWWQRLFWTHFIPWYDDDIASLGLRAIVVYQPLFKWYQGLGLVFIALLYALAYGLAVWMGRRLAGSPPPWTELLGRYAWSLLPIALVYHLAHYYTLLQTQGVRVLPMLSDPLGRGWDLFGTAGWFRYAIVPDTGFMWHSQVFLIVAGHVVGVVVAHREALRIHAEPRRAALSQLPMLLLMLLYTTSGLWILAQPIQAVGFR